MRLTKSLNIGDEFDHRLLAEFNEVIDFLEGIIWAHDQIILLQLVEKFLKGIVSQLRHVGVFVPPFIVKGLEIMDDSIPLRNGSFGSMETLLQMSTVALKIHIGLVIDPPLYVLDLLVSSSTVELLAQEAFMNIFSL